MILDNDGQSCQVANFLIGDSTTTTRSWNIRVTQYTCGQEDEAGPPGCLQYLTETQNYIQKYVHPRCDFFRALFIVLILVLTYFHLVFSVERAPRIQIF